MGAMPPAGQWVRLEVPASAVGLEGKSVRGMAFTLFGGRAAWDVTGVNTAGGSGTGTNGNSVAGIWVDDYLPAGAVGMAEGGDNWNWISSNPEPFAGGLAHQSSVAFGLHQHFFAWATEVMEVAAGETL